MQLINPCLLWLIYILRLSAITIEIISLDNVKFEFKIKQPNFSVSKSIQYFIRSTNTSNVRIPSFYSYLSHAYFAWKGTAWIILVAFFLCEENLCPHLSRKLAASLLRPFDSYFRRGKRLNYHLPAWQLAIICFQFLPRWKNNYTSIVISFEACVPSCYSYTSTKHYFHALK